MLDPIDRALVRIFSADKKRTAGVGVLVTETLVLTCAHVVEANERGFVTITFPRVDDSQQLLAYVWEKNAARDVAVLELRERDHAQPPPNAQPVWLSDTGDLWNEPFRVFGFPQSNTAGGWSTGSMLGRDAQNRIQLGGNSEGYPIQKGFSGSPVWHPKQQRVIGLVTQTEQTPGVFVSLAIPAEDLKKFCKFAEFQQRFLPECPYRGLSRFEEAHAALFFGREALVAELAQAAATKPASGTS